MDFKKTGSLISKLRHEKGLTQKEIGDMLGICAKTVSKWETGHGFPDVSLIGELSKIFRVDISKLLEGQLPEIKAEVGNVKKTKFYVCKECGNLLTSVAEADIMCCGRKLAPLVAKEPDIDHKFDFQTVEDEHYITFSHPMEKGHFISFVSYVRFDRVLTLRLYPEQSGEFRFPKMRGGKMYYYCNNHGLFEIKI